MKSTMLQFEMVLELLERNPRSYYEYYKVCARVVCCLIKREYRLDIDEYCSEG